MADDICIGPNGGCPRCYARPCICHDTDEQRRVRERRDAKRSRAQGSMVEVLDCEKCGDWAVVPDRVVRAFMCLRCGWQQQPKWIPEEQRSVPAQASAKPAP